MPFGRQAIIWTNNGLLLSGLLETNLSEIEFSYTKIDLKCLHDRNHCAPTSLCLLDWSQTINSSASSLLFLLVITRYEYSFHLSLCSVFISSSKLWTSMFNIIKVTS